MRIHIPEDPDKKKALKKTQIIHIDEDKPLRIDISDYDAKYTELLQSIYDAALITDLNGKIVDSNIRASHFFYYSPDDLKQLNMLELLVNSEKELLAFIRSSLENQRFVLIQAYGLRKDGTTFPVEVAVNMLHVAETQLCFFVRDITKRQDAEDALRESEQKFRTIFENSTDGISICEYTFGDQPMRRLIDCNDAYVNMSGRTRRELFNMNTWDFIQLVSPESYEEVEQLVCNMVPFGGTLKWRRTDGKENFIDFKSVPLQIGDRVCVYSIDRDMTAHIQAEGAVRKAQKQEAMMASIGAACHHLSQPATVLLTNLTLIKNGDASCEELAPACHEAAEHIADILHKLHAVNEYRTVPYAQDTNGSSQSKILDI